MSGLQPQRNQRLDQGHSAVHGGGLIHDHRFAPQGQPLRQFSTNAGTLSGSATR